MNIVFMNSGMLRKRSKPGLRTIPLLSAALMLTIGLAPLPTHGAEMGEVTELLKKPLPEIPGKEVTMITVDYAPGAEDPVHRHNAHCFVYVLEGSIIMQMKGGKETTLKPGETFYEDPQGVHLVGRNASKTEPAKFLVFFVKDQDAPILIPGEGDAKKEKK